MHGPGPGLHALRQGLYGLCQSLLELQIILRQSLRLCQALHGLPSLLPCLRLQSQGLLLRLLGLGLGLLRLLLSLPGLGLRLCQALHGLSSLLPCLRLQSQGLLLRLLGLGLGLLRLPGLRLKLCQCMQGRMGRLHSSRGACAAPSRLLLQLLQQLLLLLLQVLLQLLQASLVPGAVPTGGLLLQLRLRLARPLLLLPCRWLTGRCKRAQRRGKRPPALGLCRHLEQLLQLLQASLVAPGVVPTGGLLLQLRLRLARPLPLMCSARSGGGGSSGHLDTGAEPSVVGWGALMLRRRGRVNASDVPRQM
jgi:hypothetical protein